MLLIAFFLPLSKKIIPLLIIALVLNWLVEGRFIEKFKNIRNNRLVFLFVSFYLIHLIGLLYSENIRFGLFDLEVKLSLLIFPILFFSCKPINSKMIFNVFLSFYFGVFTAAIICLANALIIYLRTGHIAFFYGELSILMHPTYFAMYLNFAIVSMICFILDKPGLLNNFFRNVFLFIILFFTFFIILLSSKAGIICSVFIFTISFLYFLLRFKNTVRILIFTASVLLLYFITFKYIVSHNYQRITQAEKTFTESMYIEKSTPESNRVRIFIWEV